MEFRADLDARDVDFGRLPARNAELEQAGHALRAELAPPQQAVISLSKEVEKLAAAQALVDSALDGITVTSVQGYVVYANDSFKAMSGFGDRAVGCPLAEYYTEEEFARLNRDVIPPLLSSGKWSGMLHVRRPDGTIWMGQTSAFLLRDASGAPTGMAGFFRDVTAELEAERSRAQLQRELIAAQQRVLRTIGTPLLPIADNVIAMPLIGDIDAERANQIMEALLQGIGEHQASTVILDITGVKVMDTLACNALVSAARGAKLLGAEVVVTGTRPQVARVLAREGAGGDKRLIAYIAADTDAPGLHAYLGAFLPMHLMPSSFVVLPALPLTPNGKIDRDALPMPDRTSSPNLSAYVNPPQTRTEEILAGIWSDLFGMPMIGREDSFFELGGDSLRMARLLLRVRETFGIELSVHQVFGSPRLLDLGRVVDETLSPNEHHVTLLPPDWAIEVALDVRIRPCGKPVAPGGPLREGFLTGATGFLGAFLLRDLLRQTKARIHCLVRAGDAAQGLRRIRSNLEKYAIWDPAFGSRIVAVPGDLAKPLFGLSPEAFDSLAARIQTIYHSGAEISYVKPYDAHRAANVLGTGEALRLAFTGTDKPFHHISTIAVFGPIGHFTGLTVVPEDFELDRSVRFIEFDMGYTQSKWVAEKLCSAARARGGAITVFRPGFIMGDSATGAGNHNDFMARLIRGCVMAGAYPDLPLQRKDFVAVDDVSAAIARISLDVTLRGRAYHLVPPAAESIDLQCFFGRVRAEGHELSQLPYAEWLSRVRALCVADDSSELLPLLPMLTEKVCGELTRWELHERMPFYDDSNTRSALAWSGLGCRPMNAARLRKYLGWLEQKAGLRLGPIHESSSGRRGFFRESW